MTTQRKAKRKLSDIDFSKEDSHIALVSASQGGPANGADYQLVIKASNFSEETIQKMQQVKVTMELPDFLQKFFSLYYDDAQILAAMMGYVRPVDSEVLPSSDYWSEYINSQLASFEILKSVYESENTVESLSQLDEHQYLAMLKDQETLEKAFKKIDKANQAKEKEQQVKAKPKVKLVTAKESTVVKSAEDTSVTREVKQEVTSSDVIAEKSAVTKGKQMTKETQVIEQEVEVIAKAEFDIINKALEEQKVQLEKAMQVIAQFEAEKKEAITKAKTEKVKALVKDQSALAIVTKASLSLESEDDFAAFLAAIQAMQATVTTETMFMEKGVSTPEETQIQESAVAKILKSQFSK